MTLNEWMTNTETAPADIAAAVGCDPSWIRHLCGGKHNPSLKVAQAISDYTAGKVGLSDWPATSSSKPDQPADRGTEAVRG